LRLLASLQPAGRHLRSAAPRAVGPPGHPAQVPTTTCADWIGPYAATTYGEETPARRTLLRACPRWGIADELGETGLMSFGNGW